MLRRSGPWLGWVAAACLAPAQPAICADIFLAPRLTVETGYEYNRFATSSAYTNSENSAFLRATPALNLHGLFEDGSELVLSASATRAEYLRSSGEYRDGAEAHLEWWRTAVPLEGGLRLAGGFGRDGALPENDVLWISCVPSLRCTLPAPEWQLTAQAILNQIDYDSRENAAGDPQRDFNLEFRPGLRWLPSRNLVLWSEVAIESYDSNEETACYTGAEIALGASYWLTPRDQLAGSLQSGMRMFETAFSGTGTEVDRRDIPVFASIQYTRRVCPWLEIFCSAGWETTGSDQADQDVDAGAILIGATFAQDYELFSSGRP